MGQVLSVKKMNIVSLSGQYRTCLYRGTYITPRSTWGGMTLTTLVLMSLPNAWCLPLSAQSGCHRRCP